MLYTFLQKETDASFKARKGGPYKLNLHPKAYFDGNPYKSDRRKYMAHSLPQLWQPLVETC